MNVADARNNMLKQQCRTWEVYSESVLTLLQQVHRENFVPPAYQAFAFADMALPLAHGQTMFTPKEEARLLDVLAIGPTERVLEIGTGSGYVTVLLAHQAKHVESVDIFEDFTENTAKKLAAYNIHNVTLQTADAAQGYRKNTHYDVIILTGSTPRLPQSFLQQLNDGGRLFAIIGQAPVMQAVLFTKIHGDFQQHVLFDTYVAPFIHALSSEAFVF